MSLIPTSGLTGRTRTAIAMGAVATTLAVGGGFATAANAAPAAKAKVKATQTVKLKAAKPSVHTRVYFGLSGKYAMGKKSSWAVDFGDKWRVQGHGVKDAHPAWVWHSFGTAGKKVVRYTVTDAKGVKHVASTTITVATGPGTVPAGHTAAVGLALNKTFAVSYNGKTITVMGGASIDDGITVLVSGTASSSAKPTPSASASTPVLPIGLPTAAPTTTAAPTATPTPTAAPTSTTPAALTVTGSSIAGLQLLGGSFTTVDIYGTGFQPGAVLSAPRVTTCNVVLFCSTNPFGYTDTNGNVGQTTFISSTDVRITLTVPNSLLGGVSYLLTVRNPDATTSGTYTQPVASIL